MYSTACTPFQFHVNLFTVGKKTNIIAVFWSKVLHRPKLFAGCCFIVSLDFVFAEGRVPVATGH